MSDAEIVTLLFTDLVGSTELLERLGDDAAEQVRRAHFRLLRGAVAGRGGQEVKNLGDGLMVVFGSALQAVGCAVAMQQVVHRYNEADEGPPFQVRVGLNVGEPIRDEGDYFGTPVVVAKRLCDAAAGGQVLASEVVRSLVGSRGGYDFRSLGPVVLKGMRYPLPAWSVEWQPAERPRTTALPEALQSSMRAGFVGRDAELKRLREAWAEVCSGRRRLVMVAGEPGIGKTRLCAQLAAEALEDGGLVLFGRCDEDSVIPYQPFLEALRQLVGAGAGTGALGAEQRGELARLLPELGEDLRKTPESRGEDPETERFRLFEAVAALIRYASDGSPVLLVLDDLQWAARATVLLLRHLVAALEPAPVLLLGTYRDVELGRGERLTELLAALRREGSLETLHLSGLSDGEVRALLEGRAGHDFEAQEVELYRAVLAEAEGNPFFILEITRHLAETGRLHRQGGRWELEATSRSDLDLPEGVHDVIGRRLSRLSEEANAVLSQAAVLGREFDFDVLTAMGGVEDEALLQSLEEALAARLLVEVSGPSVATYSFTHALVRETLLHELTLPRRQRLHLRAAAAIESASAGRPGSRAAALAVHYRQAGTLAPPEKAIGASIEAGREAARALAWEEVAAHWQAALDVMGERGAEPAQRAEFLARLAALLFVTGLDVARAIDHTQQALALYEELGEEERAAGMRSRLGGYRTTFPETMDVPAGLRHLRAAEEVLARGPESSALGYVYAGVAAVGLWGLRTEEGLAASRKAMDIGERQGTVPLWVQGAAMAGYHLLVLGSLGDATELLERAWSVADEIDHRIAAMVAAWIRGGLAIRLSDPLDAGTWYERELAKSRLAQAPIQRRVLQSQLAWVRVLTGDLAGGREAIAEATELVVGENLAPPVDLWEGDWKAAVATLRAARERARRAGDRYNEAGVGRWLAEAQRLCGDPKLAEETLEETLVIALDAPDMIRELQVRLDLVLCSTIQDRLQAAGRHLERARAIVRGGEDWRGLAGRLGLAEAVVAGVAGDQEASETRFTHAVDVFRRYTLPWDEAEAHLLWGSALRESGDDARGRERLDSAMEIYRRIGAGSRWRQRAEEYGIRR